MCKYSSIYIHHTPHQHTCIVVFRQYCRSLFANSALYIFTFVYMAQQCICVTHIMLIGKFACNCLHKQKRISQPILKQKLNGVVRFERQFVRFDGGTHIHTQTYVHVYIHCMTQFLQYVCHRRDYYLLFLYFCAAHAYIFCMIYKNAFKSDKSRYTTNRYEN